MDPMATLKVSFALAACGAAGVAFWRPHGAFRFAGIALLVAVVAPFVLGLLLNPFLGSGAGMGVVFILIALAAFIATISFSAALGAALRHGWNAMR